MKKIICYCHKEILKILQKPDYQITENTILKMHSIFDNVFLHITQSTSSNLSIPIVDKNKSTITTIETINLSQVIDCPPIIRNGKVIQSKVTAVFSKHNCNLWTIVHELCHLLSTGPYYQIDSNHFLHHCGINTFLYAIKNGQLLLKSTKGHNGINELITDYITWHLLCIFHDQQIPAIYNGIDQFHSYLAKQCHGNVTVEQFIGWYFSGETKKMNDLLTNQQTISYETLHRILHTQK